MDPGKLESFGQEKRWEFMNSKIPILREVDKNMQNHSVYTHVDSKKQENEHHGSQDKGYLCGKAATIMKKRQTTASKVEQYSIS